MDWSVVITSAGIAAVVSGLINLAGQPFERKSRREELALAKGIELGIYRVQMTKEIGEATGRQVENYMIPELWLGLILNG